MGLFQEIFLLRNIFHAIFNLALHAIGCILKLTHALAQSASQLGNLVGAKEKKDDKQDDEDLATAKIEEEECCLHMAKVWVLNGNYIHRERKHPCMKRQ